MFLLAETKPPNLRIGQSLRKRQMRRSGESLTTRSAAMLTTESSNRRRFEPGGRQESCETKPIEIGHKPLGFNGLMHNIFGLTYAKQTQFRGGEDGTSKDWSSRKLAGREARTTQYQNAAWSRRSPRKLRNEANWKSATSSLPSEDLRATSAVMFMQNEPKSRGRSRTGHRAGHAGC